MTRLLSLMALVGAVAAGVVLGSSGRTAEARAAGVVFSGTVAGSDQGFLSGASVAIDGPQHKEARTDADGRFTITDVASGKYQLKVFADGYLPIERPMEVGSASVSLDVVLLKLPGL